MPLAPNVGTASWNGRAVSVTARLVPRYAWTSASIDVAIGDRAILKTGGVFKFVGRHAERFESGGGEHEVEVSWGTAALRSFPVKVQIDGVQIIASAVPIDHWWLGLWPLAALAFFFAWQALT